LMNIKPSIACLLLFLGGCENSLPPGKVASNHEFHTTPDKWEKPRIFHSQLNELSSERISVSRIPLSKTSGEKRFSPNGGYWFTVSQLDTMKPGPYNFEIDIFNERDYITRLELLDIYGNFKRQAEWINEKLLFVSVWWGRVMGTDLIFDVEQERVIYKETTNYGSIVFQQWQQAKQQ
jgi:hypothetical protein